jgi:hypothetical protein
LAKAGSKVRPRSSNFVREVSPATTAAACRPAVVEAPPLLVGVSEGAISVRRALGVVVFIGGREAEERWVQQAIRQSDFLPYKVAHCEVDYY